MKNCKYYEFDGICGSRNNVKELECKSVPLCMCYYKQLQKLKEGNKRVLKIIKETSNEL